MPAPLTCRVYQATLSTLSPLPDSSAPVASPSHPAAYDHHAPGSVVLGLFPDTTSFYRATVVGREVRQPAWMGKYSVKFDDDNGLTRVLDIDDIVGVTPPAKSK